MRPPWPRPLEGERRRKGRAAAGLALHPDASAVELDEGLADAEPETRPAKLAADAGVHLAELAEDVVELVRGNADARVGHAVHDLVPLQTRGDGDLPLLGELERVAHEIGQALGNAL